VLESLVDIVRTPREWMRTWNCWWASGTTRDMVQVSHPSTHHASTANVSPRHAVALAGAKMLPRTISVARKQPHLDRIGLGDVVNVVCGSLHTRLRRSEFKLHGQCRNLGHVISYRCRLTTSNKHLCDSGVPLLLGFALVLR
jgi:hypothetical protein